jgi:hypothetical protein
MSEMSNGQRLAKTFRITWRRQKGESDSAEEVEWVDEDQQFNPLGNWLQDMPVKDNYSGTSDPQGHTILSHLWYPPTGRYFESTCVRGYSSQTGD